MTPSTDSQGWMEVTVNTHSAMTAEAFKKPFLKTWSLYRQLWHWGPPKLSHGKQMKQWIHRWFTFDGTTLREWSLTTSTHTNPSIYYINLLHFTYFPHLSPKPNCMGMKCNTQERWQDEPSWKGSCTILKKHLRWKCYNIVIVYNCLTTMTMCPHMTMTYITWHDLLSS